MQATVRISRCLCTASVSHGTRSSLLRAGGPSVTSHCCSQPPRGRAGHLSAGEHLWISWRISTRVDAWVATGQCEGFRKIFTVSDCSHKPPNSNHNSALESVVTVLQDGRERLLCIIITGLAHPALKSYLNCVFGDDFP